MFFMVKRLKNSYRRKPMVRRTKKNGRIRIEVAKKSAKSIKNSNLPTEKIFSNPDKKRFTELKTPNQTLSLI